MNICKGEIYIYSLAAHNYTFVCFDAREIEAPFIVKVCSCLAFIQQDLCQFNLLLFARAGVCTGREQTGGARDECQTHGRREEFAEHHKVSFSRNIKFFSLFH